MCKYDALTCSALTVYFINRCIYIEDMASYSHSLLKDLMPTCNGGHTRSASISTVRRPVGGACSRAITRDRLISARAGVYVQRPAGPAAACSAPQRRNCQTINISPSASMDGRRATSAGPCLDRSSPSRRMPALPDPRDVSTVGSFSDCPVIICALDTCDPCDNVLQNRTSGVETRCW